MRLYTIIYNMAHIQVCREYAFQILQSIGGKLIFFAESEDIEASHVHSQTSWSEAARPKSKSVLQLTSASILAGSCMPKCLSNSPQQICQPTLCKKSFSYFFTTGWFRHMSRIPLEHVLWFNHERNNRTKSAQNITIFGVFPLIKSHGCFDRKISVIWYHSLFRNLTFEIAGAKPS